MKHVSKLPDEKFLLCAVLPIAIYLLAGICHGIDSLFSLNLLGGIVTLSLIVAPLYSIAAGLAGISHAWEQHKLASRKKIHPITIVLCILHMLISVGILYDFVSFFLHPPT